MHGPAVTLSIYHAEDQSRKVLTQLDIVASVSGEELKPRWHIRQQIVIFWKGERKRHYILVHKMGVVCSDFEGTQIPIQIYKYCMWMQHVSAFILGLSCLLAKAISPSYRNKNIWGSYHGYLISFLSHFKKLASHLRVISFHFLLSSVFILHI